MSGIQPNNVPVGSIIAGTSYTLGGRDFAQCLVFTSGSAIAVTLPAPGGGGGELYGNWNTSIFAQGAGTVTITPAAPLVGPTPTINGAASVTVTTGNSRRVFLGTDGNWYAPPGA
ncbi:MAG TPA: hypothetical protein VLL82_14620 [Mycobacterium sp.]|nr:hypothetical protein [Mycobacterium sp.]